MLFYNSSIALENNNIIYSIDKIRLKTYITYEEWTKIEFMMKALYSEKARAYTSARSKDFFYNYQVEVDEGISFWFGFLHNSEKRSQSDLAKYNLTVEFNPNKVQDNKLLLYLLNLTGDWYLKSYDLAIDVKVNINDILPDISGKRQFKSIINSFDDKTYYWGKGEDLVRIYNKKLESGETGLGDLTRIEQRISVDDFEVRKLKLLNAPENLPRVYLNQYIYSLSDYSDKTLLAILYAVQNGFPLKFLTNTYKKKIRNLLKGGYLIKIDQKVCTQVIRRCLLHYFLKNNKMVIM